MPKKQNRSNSTTIGTISNKKETRLEIVARSSKATSGSTTCWAIHPDIEDRCEGVAGIAWFKNLSVQVPAKDEPPLPDISTQPTNEQVREYARRTWTSEDLVRTNRWKARGFAAIVIRQRDGQKWGVLVLDSIDPQGVDMRIIEGKLFTADMLADIIDAWA